MSASFLLSLRLLRPFLLLIFASITIKIAAIMSYEQMARLEVLNAVSGIKTKEELDDFKNMLAKYFAEKAQKAIDALWDDGTIDERTIETWGTEHMRTPYAANRS